jgi:hypothetical protein
MYYFLRWKGSKEYFEWRAASVDHDEQCRVCSEGGGLISCSGGSCRPRTTHACSDDSPGMQNVKFTGPNSGQTLRL